MFAFVVYHNPTDRFLAVNVNKKVEVLRRHRGEVFLSYDAAADAIDRVIAEPPVKELEGSLVGDFEIHEFKVDLRALLNAPPPEHPWLEKYVPGVGHIRADGTVVTSKEAAERAAANRRRNKRA